MRVPPRRRQDTCGAAAILAAVSALLLVATPAAPAPAEERATPISIYVWRYHFPGEGAFLADLQGSYQRAYGRTVELYQHDWHECPRKIEQWTGEFRRYAPDMLVVREEDLPRVLGCAASLEGRFPAAFLKSFYPGVLAQGRIQGILTGLPWMVAPRALYYNADLLREKDVAPPVTPDGLLNAAKALADPPDVYGLGIPGNPEGGAADLFLTVFRSFGGVLFDERGRLSIEGAKGERTLELFCDLVNAQATQPEVLTWDEAQLAELFLRGRVAMLIDRPWLLREAIRYPPEFEVGVAPVPREKNGTEHIGTDCVIIFDTARDIDACVHFLQYALGRDPQRALGGLGVPSVRRDVAGSLPPGEGWEVFGRALRAGRGPSAATWAEIAPVFERLLYLALSGRATPQEALNAIDVDLIDDPEYLRLGLRPLKPEGKRPSREKPPDG